MSRSNPKGDTESDHFGGVSEDESPTDMGRSWIQRLVYQCWCEPEVGQIAERDVLWIRTGCVELWDACRGRLSE